MVKQIKTDVDFVQEKAHGVVVVDFFAHWCTNIINEILSLACILSILFFVLKVDRAKRFRHFLKNYQQNIQVSNFLK